MTTRLGPALAAYLAARRAEAALILPARRAVLDRLTGWIGDRLAAGGPARLLFVCTHNSRRSHLAAAWAWAAAAAAGIDGVEAFSAGTEATALHTNAAAALERAGFVVERGAGENPVHILRLAPGGAALEAFSKTLAHRSLPRGGFCAVMTCSDADSACPVVPGAGERVALPYDDPKTADGRPDAAAVYDARAAEIAREMVWVVGRVTTRE